MGALILLPWLFAVVVLAAWVLHTERPQGVHAALALLIWLAGASVAWLTWRRTPTGLLRWNGQDWILEAAGGARAGRVQCRLDGQRGALIEFRGLDGRRNWLWLAQRSAPRDWPALRRALVAPAPAPGVSPTGDGATGAAP